jgi:mono/diheme cytochrome c family protein
MALVTCAVALLLGAVPVQAVPAEAASETEESSAASRGQDLYRVHCATCHGKTGRGDGPLAESLRYAPPDLTLLARRNRGRFDPDKVHRMVDGRRPVKGHGGPEMPVWGDAFRQSADRYSEEAVKARIDAIVTHLLSIQRK